MTDIAEFLAARWDEIEELALFAHPSPWTPTESYGRGDEVWVDIEAADRSAVVETESGSYTGKPTALHILAHEPAYVLADITAKRAILQDCLDAIATSEVLPGTTWNDDAAGALVAARIMDRLAAPFADHPDFDPAWRVE